MRKIFLSLALIFGGIAFANPPGTYQPLLLSSAVPIGTPSSLGSTVSASGNSVTCTITTTANLVAGNLLAVAVQIPSNTLITVSGVVAGTNVLSVAVAQNDGANYDAEIWYIGNAAFLASGSNIVVTFSALTTGSNGYGCEALQVSGIIAAPLDQIAKTSTTSASPSITTPTLGRANELAIGMTFVTSGTRTYSESSGYTNLFNLIPGATTRAGLGTKIVSSTSGVNYAPTISTSNALQIVMATFKGN